MQSRGSVEDPLEPYWRADFARLLDSGDQLVTSLDNAVKLELQYWDGTHMTFELWDTGSVAPLVNQSWRESEPQLV